eukprot:TRINITY_DN9926_c0_g1_i1.p1 TRINITY_DN9926_c0_g1~~TRINITY_DN9926_c0_g1_i1.p1  ORF type:complete len:287 (+),score=28.77 TRINITY_DN9926_c0_g1_i1:542-1402(+)
MNNLTPKFLPELGPSFPMAMAQPGVMMLNCTPERLPMGFFPPPPSGGFPFRPFMRSPAPSFPVPPLPIIPPPPLIVHQEIVKRSKIDENPEANKLSSKEDPWLQEFLKKHSTQNASPQRDEQPFMDRWQEIDESLLALKVVTHELKQLLQLPVKDSAQLQTLKQQSLRLKASIESRLAMFNSDSSFQMHQQRFLKTQRHKRWLRHKPAAATSARDEQRRRTALFERLVDDWLSARRADDVQRRQADEQKRERERRLHRTRKQKAQDLRRMNLLVKIETLRNLRRKS